MMPPMMELLSISGTVTLRVCVNTKGTVTSATVIDGHPMAYQAALDSVQKWRFKPYRLNGRVANVKGAICEWNTTFALRRSPRSNDVLGSGPSHRLSSL